MSSLHYRQAHWMRSLLSVLVLCFALCTLAQAGHVHQIDGIPDTHHSCDLCTAFGGLIDAPTLATQTVLPPLADAPVWVPIVVSTRRARSTAQARAPPFC